MTRAGQYRPFGSKVWVTHLYSPRYGTSGRVAQPDPSRSKREGMTWVDFDGEHVAVYDEWLSSAKPRPVAPGGSQKRPAIDPRYGEELTLL